MNSEISAASLSATISAVAVIGTIELVDSVELKGLVVEKNLLPYYDELYEYTPTVSGTVLSTKGKSMSGDVVIKPIPYYETSNEFGNTVYIGGTA